MTPISSTWKVQLKELWYRFKERRKEKCRLIELTQEESVIFLRVKMSDLNKRSAVIERYVESAKKNGVHECLAWPEAWSWFSSLRSQIVACLRYKREKKKKNGFPWGGYYLEQATCNFGVFPRRPNSMMRIKC